MVSLIIGWVCGTSNPSWQQTDNNFSYKYEGLRRRMNSWKAKTQCSTRCYTSCMCTIWCKWCMLLWLTSDFIREVLTFPIREHQDYIILLIFDDAGWIVEKQKRNAALAVKRTLFERNFRRCSLFRNVLGSWKRSRYSSKMSRFIRTVPSIR